MPKGYFSNTSPEFIAGAKVKILIFETAEQHIRWLGDESNRYGNNVCKLSDLTGLEASLIYEIFNRHLSDPTYKGIFDEFRENGIYIPTLEEVKEREPDNA